MKNITLTVDDGLLDRVRVVAAARRTSVNSMVRDFLQTVVEKEEAKDDAREALLRLAREQTGDMGNQRWNREALYDR